MTKFFGEKNIRLLSVASPVILGLKDNIILKDEALKEEIKLNNGNLEKVNKFSLS